MSWIPTIELENDEGRRIKVNIDEVLQFTTNGWHRIETVDDKESEMKNSDELNAEEAAGEKISLDPADEEVINIPETTGTE